MTVAKKQFAKDYEDQVKEPAYWSGQLNQLTFRGRSLDDIAAAPAAYQAITAKQIHEQFAKCYSEENAIVVTVKPSGEKQKAASE